MNMSERTTALEMKGMHIYIDFRLGLYCFCFNAVCDWSMKETWASLSNKEMQNEKQVWLNDEHFSYLWLFTLSYQSSLVTSFSYTVKPVLGGHLRKMAGGGGPRKTGSTEKRSYKNDVKRQFEARKFYQYASGKYASKVCSRMWCNAIRSHLTFACEWLGDLWLHFFECIPHKPSINTRGEPPEKFNIISWK